MSRLGCNNTVACVWKTVRRFHFGTICLGITFVASIVILTNISNMHVQVHRSFLSFSHKNETLMNICLDLRDRMQVTREEAIAYANATSRPALTSSTAPSVNLTTTVKEENFTTVETVTCDLTQFKKGLPVAGDEKLQGSQGACPEKPSSLFGRFVPSMMPMTEDEMASMFPVVKKGGRYTPRWCKPIEKTIVIIPYRYRCAHLHTLLPVLIPMLIRQNVQFTIYVVEQKSPGKFNKGLLFNAGYLEALKRDSFDCVILHDVDLIPVNDMNLYRCNRTGPIHFSPIISKYNFKQLYNGLFGGVVGFTRDHFQKINGASNLFFGWGAEDDDLRNRAYLKKLNLLRKKDEVGVYYMVKHQHEQGWERNPDRLKIFASGKARQNIDGLNSVKYNATDLVEFPMFTWVGIDFDKDIILKSVPPKLMKGKLSNVKPDKEYRFTYV